MGKRQRELTKEPVFDAPNYTQAPNQFFDELLRKIDDLSELKVTLLAIRQTFGFHRTKAEMSVTFFEEGTGLSRNSARRGIDLSVKRGTLRMVKEPTRTTSAIFEISVSPEVRDRIEGVAANDIPSARVVQPMLQGGAAAESQPMTPRNKDIEKKELKKEERESAPSKRASPVTFAYPPSVSVFQEVTGCLPEKIWRDVIDSDVGARSEDLEFWRLVVRDYIGTYPNPKNVKAMLDFYHRRELPGTKPKSNGHDAYAPEGIPRVSEMRREDFTDWQWARMSPENQANVLANEAR